MANVISSPLASLIQSTQTPNSENKGRDLQMSQMQQSISTLGQSISTINTQIVELNTGLKKLGVQLQNEATVEEKNIKDEQESERRLEERKIRLGQESVLEQKITSALASPIASLQQKVSNTFGNIMSALQTVFFGWLTNQGIETLKALASGSTKKLEEIKWNVIKNVAGFVGIFVAANVGIGVLLRTITGLTSRVLSLGVKVALAPFRALGSAIRKIGGGGGAAEGAARGAAEGAGRGLLGTLGRIGMPTLFGGLDFFQRKGEGQTNLQAGAGALSSVAAGEAGIFAGSKFPGWTKFIAMPLLGGFGYFGGGQVANAFTGVNAGQTTSTPAAKPTPTPAAKPTPTPAAKPTPTPTPAAKPTPQIVPTPTSTSQPQQPQTPMFSAAFTAPELTGEISAEQSGNTFTSPNTSQSSTFETDYSRSFSTFNTPEQIQAPPKLEQQPITPLPEQKPNIIISDGGNQTTQMNSPQQGSLTDVPLIPSSNPDNFYTLYSQLNYNVVI